MIVLYLLNIWLFLFMMKFSFSTARNQNGTVQTFNPWVSLVFNLKFSFHIWIQAYPLPFSFQNLELLNPQLSQANLIILAKCFFLIQLIVHLSLPGIWVIMIALYNQYICLSGSHFNVFERLNYHSLSDFHINRKNLIQAQ